MKILFVAPSWIGDMTMAQSLFKQCRADYPDAVMDVVAPEWSLPLLGRMPEIRKGIALPIGHGRFAFFKRRAIGRSLSAEKYDWAIVTPRTWKAALVPFFAGVPRRTGFTGEMRYGLINDRRKLDKKRLNQTILRLLALAEGKHAPYPPEVHFFPELTFDPENQKRLVAELALSLDRPVICFCPGAEYGPAKQWPIPYFQELARKLMDKGYQVWTMGSEKEKELGEKIAPANSGCYRNLCGKTRLEDTIDLMQLAVHGVTNDSGLMHVAAASGLRIEAIYGSSSPAYTPPLTQKANIHYLGLDCSPCFKRTCPLVHLNCLHHIRPERIFTSILEHRLHREHTT